jgi:hypothetical protein
MTKLMMIEAIHAGHKVRHRYFSPDEWMKLATNGQYEFEDGVKCDPAFFWMDRKQDFWNYDWEIINP